MDRGLKLPYLGTQTSTKVIAIAASSRDVGIIGHHTSPGKLRPLTRDMSMEEPTCNTEYVTVVRPTSYCSHSI